MNRIIPIIIVVALGFFIFSAVNLDYGEKRSGIYEYYLKSGVADTGALNIVTAIYLDYRAYDTLGEATVFFAAALGVFMLLNKKREGDKD
ncbi:MAG: hydrogen gas-evolving membrane-bound hydrogenase subunit E [bacterium]|nr:hypothetical protein [Candidatus Margulisiibacteriota bacterium]